MYLGDIEVTNYDAVMSLSSTTTAHTANTEIHVTQALLDRITELENKVLYNGHEYVEIGGLKWATMNIGANSVTDYGLYFQWGDISGYTTDQVGRGEGKKYFDYSTYKYSDNGTTAMTKYNSTDGKTVLDISDDAARANWGGSWRIPTNDECVALSNATTSAWTDDYQGSGVSGVVLTDKTDESKTLFFPAASKCQYGEFRSWEHTGLYISSNLVSTYDTSVLYFYSFTLNINTVSMEQNARCYGHPVRGVVG